jgi:hypothetical protein
MVKEVETLVRLVLVEGREALNQPAVHRFLDHCPGGKILRTMIGLQRKAPVTVEPVPDMYRTPRVQTPVGTTPQPQRTEPLPFKKADPGSGVPPMSKPPIPVGTSVRMLTGEAPRTECRVRVSTAPAGRIGRVVGPSEPPPVQPKHPRDDLPGGLEERHRLVLLRESLRCRAVAHPTSGSSDRCGLEIYRLDNLVHRCESRCWELLIVDGLDV